MGIANNRNIHVELNFRVNSKKLQLLIHYETEPYLTQKEIEAKNYNQLELIEFKNRRIEFKKKLHGSINAPWKAYNHELQLAKVEMLISDDTTKQDIEMFLIENFDKAYDSIFTALNMHES